MLKITIALVSRGNGSMNHACEESVKVDTKQSMKEDPVDNCGICTRRLMKEALKMQLKVVKGCSLEQKQKQIYT